MLVDCPGFTARLTLRSCGQDLLVTVRNRFRDEFTSVRAEAIDLVQTYIQEKPQLAAQYFDALVDSLRDTGASCMGMLRREVLSHTTPCRCERPQACGWHLLQHATAWHARIWSGGEVRCGWLERCQEPFVGSPQGMLMGPHVASA